MIKYVPSHTIEDDESFPYDFKNWDYSTELLHSALYSVWWTTIPEDSDQELSILMDYDGFIEWYNSNMNRWERDALEEGGEVFTAEEYLPYHIGRTICVVKEMTP